MFIPKTPQDQKSPAEVAYEQADSLIGSSGGVAGNGSTAAEKKAAENMATVSSQFRKATIQKVSTPRSLFGAMAKAADAQGFMAYCKRKGDEVLFLLHVPDLRKFDDGAKELMAENAWTAALMAVSMMPEPKPKKMSVATKGIASYDRLIQGTVVDELSDEVDNYSALVRQRALGITYVTSEHSTMEMVFIAFFREPVAKSKPAPVAPTP